MKGRGQSRAVPRDEAPAGAAPGVWFPVLARLSPTARRLILCRAARSVGQGALVVDFALYLSALGWTAADMGAIFMGGMAFGATLTLLAGPLSDRIGRQPFLIFYGVTQVIAAAIALATADPLWLGAASVAGAFGRGANGAAGPFGPVEQAWLASDLAAADFGPVYSFNAAVGYGGMAAGALFAALPSLWPGGAPHVAAYRALFLLPLFGAVVTIVLLARASDPPAVPQRGADGIARPPTLDRRERGLLARLVAVNTLNGLATGVIGPFMAYWFHLRFAAGPDEIAPVLAGGFVLAGLGSLWAGYLTRRLGMARAVVAMRLVGLVLLVALPFAPNFAWAALCYVLNAACNRGTSGARQAVGLRLVGPGRRGLAASLNTISMQIPRAFGPVVGGVLLDAGFLAPPLLIAAALQTVYLVLYARMFGRIG